MARVLIVGGTGALGRELVTRLAAAGHAVRATSRRSPPGEHDPSVEWVQADVATGEGLDGAVRGVEVVVDAVNEAGTASRDVMVGGIERLLEVARRGGVQHLVYPSIVGIERVPMPYYQHKLAAEERIVSGGVPYTILRATQFHPFVDFKLHQTDRFPIPVLPAGTTLQPVDVGEVAGALVEVVAQGPAGRAPDFAGPEILPLRDVARAWLLAQGRKPRMISVPFPGKVWSALRSGALTNPEARRGAITWEEWLESRY